MVLPGVLLLVLPTRACVVSEYTVEPLSKGHFETNINSDLVTKVLSLPCREVFIIQCPLARGSFKRGSTVRSCMHAYSYSQLPQYNNRHYHNGLRKVFVVV